MSANLRNVLIVLAASCAACTTTARTNQVEPGTAAHSGDDTHEVVPLKYAPSDELAHVLGDSMAGRGVRIQSYPRTNSLILVGSRSQIEAAKQLIAELDVQTKSK